MWEYVNYSRVSFFLSLFFCFFLFVPVSEEREIEWMLANEQVSGVSVYYTQHTHNFIFLSCLFSFSLFFSLLQEKRKREKTDIHTRRGRRFVLSAIVCWALRVYTKRKRETHTHTHKAERNTHKHTHKETHWLALVFVVCAGGVLSRRGARARLLSSQVRSSNSRVLRLKISSLSIWERWFYLFGDTNC